MTSLLAGVAALRRFARPGSASRMRAEAQRESDVCEVCAVPIGATHEHLFAIDKRTLVCACAECGLVGATPGTKRIVPRAQRLTSFVMSDAEWEGLGVPVGLAFFYTGSSTRGVHAVYPGAAGAMDAAVDAEAWASLAVANPILTSLADDVEALLVNRLREQRDVYAVSIDVCFRLVGAMRSSSGDAAVDLFFASLGS
jgi:hypothetical protein